MVVDLKIIHTHIKSVNSGSLMEKKTIWLIKVVHEISIECSSKARDKHAACKLSFV